VLLSVIKIPVKIRIWDRRRTFGNFLKKAILKFIFDVLTTQTAIAR